MAKNIIDGFEHPPGVHCGSSAFTDAARFIGLPWSEPLVFGLAAGVGFYLITADGASPSRMIAGRSGLFEQSFTENTGLVFDERTTRDASEALQGVLQLIDGGEPVLIKSDIRYLPHYDTQTAFNGHKVVVAGYDEEAEEVYVADTHFEGLQPVGYEALKQALSSDGPPTFWSECMYGPLRRSTAERSIDEAIRQAMAMASLRMLEDPSGFGGVTAIETLADQIESYQTLEDASWIAKFGYQVIEKRGTGGGNFRRLYAAFLGEAVALADVDPSLSEQMTEIADAWTEFATTLKRASDGDAADWTEAAKVATRIAALERAYHERIVG